MASAGGAGQLLLAGGGCAHGAAGQDPEGPPEPGPESAEVSSQRHQGHHGRRPQQPSGTALNAPNYHVSTLIIISTTKHSADAVSGADCVPTSAALTVNNCASIDLSILQEAQTVLRKSLPALLAESVGQSMHCLVACQLNCCCSVVYNAFNLSTSIKCYQCYLMLVLWSKV